MVGRRWILGGTSARSETGGNRVPGDRLGPPESAASTAPPRGAILPEGA